MSRSAGERLVECRVVDRRWVGPELALLTLRPPERLEAEPGQFAMLRGEWGTAPLLGRPMSILGAGDRLEFLVRRCGTGTAALTELEPGRRVTVLAPLGQPFGTPRSERVVIVAGGCGLAPTLFAARALASRGLRPVFLYGARTAAGLVLAEAVAEVAELRLATDDGSAGHEGPVTELLEPALAEPSGGRAPEVWCCGPEAMMSAVAALARRSGARCLVSVEERMACGRGLCLGCVRMDAAGAPRYVCVHGPVFDASELYGEGHG